MGIMYKLMRHKNLTMDLSTATHIVNNTNSSIKSERNRLITIEGNIIEAPESTNTHSLREDLNKNMETNVDKQFTAEHIIQLCKFLAEKSKRNKNLYKQQQSPKKLTKIKQSQFQFHQMDYEDNDDEIDFYQNEALPLLTKQRLEQQQSNHANEDENEDDEKFVEQNTAAAAVLSTRLSPDIKSLNISSNTTTSATSCALQHHQQQQQQQSQQQQQLFNYQHQQQQYQHQTTPQNQGKRDILLKIRRQIFERKRLRENGAFEPQALNNSQVWRPW